MCSRFIRFLEETFTCFSRTDGDDEATSEDQSAREESRRSSRASSDKEETFQSYSDEEDTDEGEDVVESTGRRSSRSSSYEDSSSIAMGSISSIPNATTQNTSNPTTQNRSNPRTTQSTHSSSKVDKNRITTTHHSKSNTKRQTVPEPEDVSDAQAKREAKRQVKRTEKQVSTSHRNEGEHMKNSHQKFDQQDNRGSRDHHKSPNKPEQSSKSLEKKLSPGKETPKDGRKIHHEKKSTASDMKPTTPNNGRARKKSCELERKPSVAKVQSPGKLVRFKGSNSSQKSLASSRGSVRVKKSPAVTKSETKPAHLVGSKINPSGSALTSGKSVFAKSKTKANSRGPPTFTSKSIPKRMPSRSFKSRGVPVGIMKKR